MHRTHSIIVALNFSLSKQFSWVGWLRTLYKSNIMRTFLHWKTELLTSLCFKVIPSITFCCASQKRRNSSRFMFMWTEVEQVYSNDEMSFFLPKTRVPAFSSIPFGFSFFQPKANQSYQKRKRTYVLHRYTIFLGNLKKRKKKKKPAYVAWKLACLRCKG